MLYTFALLPNNGIIIYTHLNCLEAASFDSRMGLALLKGAATDPALPIRRTAVDRRGS